MAAATTQELNTVREAIIRELDEIKGALKDFAEAMKSENDRRRADVGDLYDKDRELRERLGKVETRLDGVDKALDQVVDTRRFALTQWVSAAGVLVALAVGFFALVK